jgi:nicotinamide/nicotinate riboside kinase
MQIADDSFWKDPPGIFDKVVWPAYVEAHKKHFESGDVENGKLKDGQDMLLLEERSMDMQAMVEKTCESILARVVVH